MFEKTAAGVVLAMLAASLSLVGVAFAGYAIYSALLRPLGVPGAAALTAFILLVGPVVFAVTALLRGGERSEQSSGELAMLHLLTGMAKDKPLLAVISAGVYGAVDMFLKKRR